VQKLCGRSVETLPHNGSAHVGDLLDPRRRSSPPGSPGDPVDPGKFPPAYGLGAKHHPTSTTGAATRQPARSSEYRSCLWNCARPGHHGSRLRGGRETHRGHMALPASPTGSDTPVQTSSTPIDGHRVTLSPNGRGRRALSRLSAATPCRRDLAMKGDDGGRLRGYRGESAATSGAHHGASQEDHVVRGWP
jgi:hypothetical protein